MARRSKAAGALIVALVAIGGLGCTATSTVASGPTSVSAPVGAPTTEERVDAPGSSADVSTKKVFKRDQPAIAMLVGEKFAIRLPEDPATGQAWTIISAPDERLVKPDGDSFKAEPSPNGSSQQRAGQHEFKFKARAAGATTITLSRPGSGDPERATFTITIS